MRINQLIVKGYRNLEDVNIEFPNSNMIAFIGNNGSGKSNILELIAQVFAYTKNCLSKQKTDTLHNVHRSGKMHEQEDIMDKYKQALFIKTILAEEALKDSEHRNGAGYETHLCRRNYEDLLDLVETSGWFEEYRSFKIMAALYFANNKRVNQLPAAV